MNSSFVVNDYRNIVHDLWIELRINLVIAHHGMLQLYIEVM